MPGSSNLLAGIVSFLLTLMIFSYLLGDNPLFRVAVYVFVGVSAGYVAVVILYQVILADLLVPLFTASLIERLLLIIPMILSVLIMMKISRQLSWLGSPAMAYLVGAGAAVAVGGAVLGTLFPQTLAAFNFPSFISAISDRTGAEAQRLAYGLVVAFGTISTLIYFQFGAGVQPDGTVSRSRIVEAISWVGRIFIAITFGMLFAGLYAAAMTALIERLNFIINFFGSF
jgi:hypothetical protein